MKKENDRRVKFTKMILSNALLSLMKEKPISKITPTELCRKADINRNTFYAHYSYPEELLQEIEDSLYEQIKLSMNFSNTKNLFNGICNQIKQNEQLCSIIFLTNETNSLLQRLINEAHDKIITEWGKISDDITLKECESLFIYCTSGSIALIKEWVKNGLKESPEEIADLLNKLNNHVPEIRKN